MANAVVSHQARKLSHDLRSTLTEISTEKHGTAIVKLGGKV